MDETATSNVWGQIVLFLQNNRLALSLICILGFLICLKIIMPKPQEVRKASQWTIYKRRFKHWLKTVYSRTMDLATHIPIVGDIVGNIAHSYKCHEALTNEEANIRTGKTLFYVLLVFVVAFMFGMCWFNDILMSLVTAVMLAHITLSSLKSSTKKFLVGLNDAIEDFLLAYHKSSGNIDQAFFAVANTVNPVARHFTTMHEYIKRAYVSNSPDIIQREYNEIAPSRHLKNIYTIIYMTYKYGDQKNDGKSALNVNLMEIQEQLGDALYQQNTLLDDTMGERWFIILPLYAIPLLTSYMLTYFSFEGFEYIEAFVTSSTGYMVEILCAIISLVCYLLYAQMVDRGILEPKSNATWEKDVLRNAYIRKIVLKLLPPGSPKRKKMQETINKSGSTDSVDALQIQRVFLAGFLCVVAIISTFLNVTTNTITINNDIYTGLPKDNYTQVLMTQEDMYIYIDEMLAADKEVVYALRKNPNYWQLNEDEQKIYIDNYLKDTGLDAAYRTHKDYGIQRIQSKLNHLNMVGGLSNVLFVLLLTLVGYYMPLWLKMLRAFMNKDMLLLDEVSDLQKTTIMLMEYPTTTPDSLLTWYSSSAVFLGQELRECRVTHDFAKLINLTSYKPFIQLVTSLEMAFNGLTLKDAFSGVEQRLLTQRKEQGRIMERMLKFRVDTVEMFTSISMGAVVGLYMFMPLLIAMIQMFLSLDFF